MIEYILPVRLADRENYCKDGAGIGTRFDIYTTTMELNDSFHNRKPHAKPPKSFTIKAAKDFKYGAGILLIKSPAIILKQDATIIFLIDHQR